jgi:predicted flap endonuclease-1-like 5' DNA nuclease
MWYLIMQYWFWLLLALVLGLLIGWLTCGDGNRRWGWLPFGIIAAVIAALAAIMRWVNGVPALWLETGVLLFASYLIGCCLGCWLKKMLAVEPVAVAEPAPLPKPVMVSAPVPPPPPVVPKPAPVAKAAPTPVKLAEPAAAAALPDEDKHAGKRPAGLVAARGGKADDLKWVKGIGKQNEGRLHGLGIWHFDQIAAWTRENIEWVGSYLAFPGRIDREEWIKQAKALASGKETEFSKRAKWGQVATSRDDGSLGQGNVEKLSANKRPANAGKGKLPPKPKGK